jgi:UDPglucose 6-dehydrogenase
LSIIKIGVVGNGFVGSAVAHGFSQAYDVMVHDKIDAKCTHTLQDLVAAADYIFVCVPTPSSADGSIDLSMLEEAMTSIHRLRSNPHPPNQLIAIKSTTVPGTCDKYIDQWGEHVLSNPEFLTQRNAKLDFINPSRIIIGSADRLLAHALLDIYMAALGELPYMIVSPTAAELTKYMSNCFFATKISFMNEMYQIAEKLCPDEWETIVDGFALSGRVARSHLDVPGPDGKLGYGGACFPKDVKAMIQLARQLGVLPTVLGAANSKNFEVRHVQEAQNIDAAEAQEVTR